MSADGDTYIEPKVRKSMRKSRIEPQEEDREPEQPKEEAKSKGISGTIKEHKFMIIVLAIIIVLLILAFVWLFTKDDKKQATKRPGKDPTESETNPPTTNSKQGAAEPTPPPPAAPEPKQGASVSKVTAPPAVEKLTNTPVPAIKKNLSHEQIVNTVDDNELINYMHIDTAVSVETGDDAEKSKKKSQAEVSYGDLNSYDLDA